MPRLITAFQARLAKLGWFYAIALAISAGSLWAFLEVADEALEYETLALNQAILLWIHGYAHPATDSLALALAAIGSLWGILAVGGLAGIWFYRKQRLMDLMTLVVALSGTAILTFVLKSAFHQARPNLFPRLVEEVTYSFPSGHASMSLCLYGFIGGWLVAQAPTERWRWALGGLCVAFAGLIGLSRMYLGVHWPTDVLAGFIIAVFWLVVCIIGRQWLVGRIRAGQA